MTSKILGFCGLATDGISDTRGISGWRYKSYMC
jgi:hypothetical protein